MKLTRDKSSELYDATCGIFEQGIPKNYYEVVLRGTLAYPYNVEELTWIKKSVFEKCEETDQFIHDLLVNMNETDLQIRYEKIQNIIDNFIDWYCDKYEMLPYDFALKVVTEPIEKSPKDNYKPVTIPFKLFITYNDNGKHYRVELEDSNEGSSNR